VAAHGRHAAGARDTILACPCPVGLAGIGGAFLGARPGRGRGRGDGPAPATGLPNPAIALKLALRPSGSVLVAVLYGALSQTARRTTVIATGVPSNILVVVIRRSCWMFVAAAQESFADLASAGARIAGLAGNGKRPMIGGQTKSIDASWWMGYGPLKQRQPTASRRQGAKSGQDILRDKGRLPASTLRAGRVSLITGPALTQSRPARDYIEKGRRSLFS